jgi:aryl-alcohol dehydrogenase-like predicted oxidoreductase
LQIEYSLLERTPERELIPMAAALGLTVTAWSPLANGLLSGKYRVTDTGVQSEDGKSRLDNSEMQQFIGNRERANRVVDTLKTVAKEAGHSPAQIALGVAASAATPCHSHRGRSQAGAARSQPGDCRLAPFKRASARLK